MLSLDASSYLLIVVMGAAIYLVLRRRAVEPPKTRRPFGSVRSLTEPLEKEHGEQRERPLAHLRWQVEMHDLATQLKGELDSKLSALQALIIIANRESDRLEAAIKRAESMELTAPTDSLAVLERLGDPTSLADPQVLRKAVAALPSCPNAAGSDPFQGQQTDLNVANLAAKGLSASEIARRLNMPLGEVEIRLNLVPR